jgi:hypothetical protein
MRRTRDGFFVLAAALLTLGGCSNDAHLKPPRPEQTYNLPPIDDPRFSRPPQYPESVLNKFPKKDTTPDDPNAPPKMSPSRFSGSGVGGPGM